MKLYIIYFNFQVSEVLKNLFKKGTIPVLLASMTLASNNLQTVNDKQDDIINFHSLQYALFITSFVEVLGAIFFYFAASHIVKDKEIAEMETQGWPSYTPIVN